MLPTSDQVEFWLFTVLCAGLGAYGAAYLKKKGENLATHEDIAKLVEQMKATTEATKAIEARIDDQVWNKQRQWELRRDTLIEVIRAIGAVRNAHYGVIGAFKAAKVAPPEKQSLWMSKQGEAIETWRKATNELDSGRVLVAVLGDAHLNNSLREFGKAVRNSYRAITKDEPEERFNNFMENMNRFHEESLAASRVALGIDTVTLQSSELLAALDPAPLDQE